MATLSVIAAAALALSLWLFRQQEIVRLAEGNYGLVALALRPFDLDDSANVVPARKPLPTSWKIHAAGGSPEGAEAPLLDSDRNRADERGEFPLLRLKSQPSVLRIQRPGCEPVVLPLNALPSYADTLAAPARLEVPFPTCEATYADMVKIPGGLLHYMEDTPGGLVQREANVPDFYIDTYEVSHKLMTTLWTLAHLTLIKSPPNLQGWPEDNPAVAVRKSAAEAYCGYFGKRLPTDLEWRKAARREGAGVFGTSKDEMPRGMFPGKLRPARSPTDDLSALGVHHMLFNAKEWTRTEATQDNPGMYVIKGGPIPPRRVSVIDFVNMRPPETLDYELGFRCVR